MTFILHLQDELCDEALEHLVDSQVLGDAT